MTKKSLIWRSLLGLAAVGAVYTSAASARTYVDVDVRVAPPAARYERFEHRPGYVWTPGYWNWNGGRHVWVEGNYVRERSGYAYVPARWERHGDQWRLRNGYWDRHDYRDDHRYHH